MKLTIKSAKADVTGRLGPLCIACGNTKRFRIRSNGGEVLCEIPDLPEGEVRILACGRCGSRHSIVVSHVD
jgi:hypothetical protein